MDGWQNEDDISRGVRIGKEVFKESVEEANKYFQQAYGQIYLHFEEIDRYCVARLHPHFDRAHETAHDIFLGVWVGLPKFQFQSTWRTWVYGIADRRIASTLRSIIRERERFTRGDQTEQERRPQAIPEALHRQREQVRLYENALSHLERDERAILLMFYTYKMKMPQIAHILGMSLPTAYRRRAEATKKCNDFIERMERGTSE